MADPRPPRKDMDVFVHQVNILKKKQRVASTPTGTQRFRSVEQLQATIATLQDQVNDLVGRVITSATGTDPFTDWTSTQADDVPWGESVTIDLAEPRRVFVDFSVYVELAANRTTTPGHVLSGVQGGVIVNGTPLPVTDALYVSAAVGTGAVGESTAAASLWGGYARASHAVDLPAGTHTIQGSLAKRQVTISLGTGSGRVSAGESSIRVDVAQRVTL